MSRLLDAPTPTAARALDVARQFCSAAVLNHCLRSYAFAESLAVAEGYRPDLELLYVAALLHDIGLVPTFDSASVPFELAGGSVGQVFATGAGWDAERSRRVYDVIDRHMWPRVDPALDVEGYLLERATSLDVRGVGADGWPASVVAEVRAQLPRLTFDEEFVPAIHEQAARKPISRAARLSPRLAAT